MTLPCIGGSVTELSVTGGCLWRGDDKGTLSRLGSRILVNTAHLAKSLTKRGSDKHRSASRDTMTFCGNQLTAPNWRAGLALCVAEA
jgi:hypothetical protein